jgi:D-alanine transaminase
MAKIAYVNGWFSLQSEASINIEDRGLQFGDAVYEVWAFKDYKLMDEAGHFTRLQRSLDELGIDYQVNQTSMKLVIMELIRKNRVRDGMVYLQISRGTAPRDHKYPDDVMPNVIFTVKPLNFASLNAKAQKGIKITFLSDNRWSRVDIKTTNLLGNVIAKQYALDNGFDDVWYFDKDGFITEGTSNNAWIIDENDNLITREISNDILSGITRKSVIESASQLGLKIIERKFTIDEARNAKEAFITSATQFVMPVVKMDQNTIGGGSIGLLASKLRTQYLQNNM